MIDHSLRRRPDRRNFLPRREVIGTLRSIKHGGEDSFKLSGFQRLCSRMNES